MSRGIKAKPLDPAVCSRIATLAALNKTHTEIAEELGLSTFLVRRTLKSPESKAIIKAVDDTFIAAQVDVLKVELARLLTKAVKVIEFNLEENNLEAVKVLFKGVGVDAQTDKGESNQNITVIMPGASQEKVIEVVDEDDQRSGFESN